MVRAAGNKGYYRVAVLDQEDNIKEEWKFPSVTTILDEVLAKPRLLHWYYTKGLDGIAELSKLYGNKLPSSDVAGLRTLLKEHGLSPYSVKGRAAKKGTDIHSQLESLATGGEATHPGLNAWWKERGLTPADVVATETPLVSFKHKYAGTLDLVYIDPASGTRVLCDLKTGKSIHWNNFIQQAAYREAWEEQGGEPIDAMSILHVPAAESTWKEVTEEVPFSVFKGLIDVYHMLPSDWKPDDLNLDE